MAQPLADLSKISDRLQPATRHVRFPGETAMSQAASPVHALQAAAHQAWLESHEGAVKTRTRLGLGIVTAMSLLIWTGFVRLVF